MNLSAKRQPRGLPRTFPVGTTYVVEGRGGEDGQLCVVLRYVVLPGGRRINLAADLGGPSALCSRRRPGGVTKSAQIRAKSRSKKNWIEDGTTRRPRR